MPVADSPEETHLAERDGDLPINEVFYSLQGEGRLAGVPSVFVRTSGCNLRCWFCDSYHTSWEPTHAWMDHASILEAVTSFESARHVVLTGGEPLLHEASVDLLETLAEQDYHTTVETNGTIDRDAPIDLVSISPKLANSTPTPARDPSGDGEWAERHERERIDREALVALIERYDFQLKFVVANEADIEEILALLEELEAAASVPISTDDVLLMPEGATRDRIAQTASVAADLALEYGFRYTPRLHVDLWNDAPGT